MSLSSSFHLLSFQQKVANALHIVERTLEFERKPRLAGEQQQQKSHTYGHKFGLVNVTTNMAILAFITCLEKLGLDYKTIIAAAVLLHKKSTTAATTTLRFDASTEWTFIKEVEVTVPMDVSWTENEETMVNNELGEKNDNDNNNSPTTTEKKTRVMKAVNHVTEFHWEVNNVWTISVLYSGSSNVEQQQQQQQQDIIQSRSCETTIITQSKDGIIPGSSSNLLPIELSLTWLLNQIDTTAMMTTPAAKATTAATTTPSSSSDDEHHSHNHNQLESKFKVDMEAQTTKTPRRNNDIDQAIEFTSQLRQWCSTIRDTFIGQHLRSIIEQAHNPAIPQPRMNTVNQVNNVKGQYVLFNPILPLMKDDDENNRSINNNDHDDDDDDDGDNENESDSTSSILLSQSDISKLLNQHAHTLDTAINSIQTSTSSWPTNESDNLLSSSEAKLSLIISHVMDLANQYIDTMAYVESMLESQLIRAIGKRITHSDLNQFIIQHNAKLINPSPRPFSHAIRRGMNHTPVGLLTIEENVNVNENGCSSEDNGGGVSNNCIYTHSREVVQPPTNLSIPLNAATILTLTGRQYLHGYMKYRFGTSGNSKGNSSSTSTHRLVARARQFSSFILIIGNMTNVSTLNPKDAIIITNKDEVIVSLLLDELPTAKEFTDAVQSLSPEQQRFARAYRTMQLSSSVFGVCIVQIKPQMEKLLGLPANSLDKEMKLTQELMELFVEYQIPSDMLSYTSSSSGSHDDEDVDDGVATQDKIDSVKENVKNVLDVITSEKEKQLKYEQTKTDMAMEGMLQQGMNPSHSVHHSWGDENEDDVAVTGAPSTRRGGAVSHNHRRLMFKSAGRPPPPPMMMMACAAPENSMTDHYANDMSSDTPSSHQPIYNDKTERRTIHNSGETKRPSANQGLDFTVIPQILDRAIDKYAQSNALRTTTIKAGTWSRNRQSNLLSNPKLIQLSVHDMKSEKNKAFDLLDALSRSGSLSIEYSDLHVIVTVTHCFDKDIMSTVVCDNINPIEKLELSTLLVASVIHGKSIKDIIQDTEVQRLTGLMPALLLQSSENDNGILDTTV
jgi:hypothetical protein